MEIGEVWGIDIIEEFRNNELIILTNAYPKRRKSWKKGKKVRSF
jgi:hypothetical protein